MELCLQKYFLKVLKNRVAGWIQHKLYSIFFILLIPVLISFLLLTMCAFSCFYSLASIEVYQLHWPFQKTDLCLC